MHWGSKGAKHADSRALTCTAPVAPGDESVTAVLLPNPGRVTPGARGITLLGASCPALKCAVLSPLCWLPATAAAVAAPELADSTWACQDMADALLP
jgi:hypothetical protein